MTDKRRSWGAAERIVHSVIREMEGLEMRGSTMPYYGDALPTLVCNALREAGMLRELRTEED